MRLDEAMATHFAAMQESLLRRKAKRKLKVPEGLDGALEPFLGQQPRMSMDPMSEEVLKRGIRTRTFGSNY